jgi:iron complex outermembrane receptor protein
MFRAEVAPFFHDITDYITQDVPPTVNPYEQNKNYDSVEVKGVEVNATVTPYKDLLFKIAYVYIDASNESPGRVSDKVRNVPEYTFNFGVEYIIPKIRTQINWTLLYLGESYDQFPTPTDATTEVVKNKGYQLANVRISQPFISGNLNAYISADNLFDENYEPNAGQPAAGRKIWIGVTYKY